jgi:hypothetical protein
MSVVLKPKSASTLLNEFFNTAKDKPEDFVASESNKVTSNIFGAESVDSFLIEHNLIKISVKPDGHCLIHSIVEASKHNQKPEEWFSYEFIKSVIIKEYQKSRSFYGKWIDKSVSSLDDQIQGYVSNNVFDNDIGDILPLILANAINTKIIIFDDCLISKYISVFVPSAKVYNTNPIYLLLKSEHYSLLISNDLPRFTNDLPDCRGMKATDVHC